MSRKPTAAFGGDLAKSVDWTVLHGLDEDGCTSEHHRFQLPWKATMDRIRLICGYVTSFLDSTGVGDPIWSSCRQAMKSIPTSRATSSPNRASKCSWKD